jgi:membrane protease YdiL (CAAX protease family)
MKTPESFAVFSIAATVASSFIYFLILDMIKRDGKVKTSSQLIHRYLFRKISGFLILGLIPAILAGFIFSMWPAQAGFIMGESLRLWPWIIGASFFFIGLNYFNSKNAELRAIYPELRLKQWTGTSLAIGIGGWILYLAAYEYLFRGLLLFSCIEAFGLWPALTVNLALYAALHLPKGMKEAIAAIPFGGLICYLTIETGSIFPAILIHTLQAVSCEIFCINRNTEMKFHLTKTHQP